MAGISPGGASASVARVEVDASKKNKTDFVLWFTNSKFKDQK